MICIGCKKEIPDAIRFCPYCGSKQEAGEQFAPVTRSAEPVIETIAPAVKPAEDNSAFARADDDKTVSLMGETQSLFQRDSVTPQTQTRTQTQPPFERGYYPNVDSAPKNEYTVPPQPDPKPQKKKKSAALIIVLIIFAFLIIVAIVVFGILFAIIDKNKDDGKQEYITYLVSNELYYAEKENINNPIKIADIDYDDEAYYYVVENTVARGDSVFYVQDVEYVEGNPVFSVYMKNIKKNSEPVKISGDVTSGYFAVDPKGEKVIYTQDSVVYYSDLEEAHRIAGDVIGWCVDDSVESIMFLRDDGETMTLCAAEITENASPEKLVDGIALLHSVSDDMTKIIYSKENGLYIYQDGAEKFISADVEDVYGEDYETFYYVAKSEEGVSKSTYFNDDLASSDANITEPDINNYREYYYGFSFTSPEYYDALEAYNVKLNRDKVREMAATPISSYDLYYYNGNSGTLVCKDVELFNIYYDDSRIVFNSYDAVSAKKFNMSDLSVIEDFETFLLESRSGTLTTCFASGSEVAREITFGQTSAFEFTDDAVYYLDNHIYYEDSLVSKGDLKKITVASDGTATSSLIERDVNHFSIINDEGKVGYFKEINSKNCGKFYVDGELIEDDVFIYSVNYTDGKYYLFKGYDYNANKGELCIVENGETSIISETASGYNSRMEGHVFYSSDMKSDAEYNYTFNINSYDGTESVLMASDAIAWNILSDYFLECDKDTMIFLTGYRYYYSE